MSGVRAVGRFTLGVSLVVLGVGVLCGANGAQSVLPWLLRFWPALLVVLGLEVLVSGARGGARLLDPGAVVVMATLIVSCAAAYACAVHGWDPSMHVHFSL